MQPAQLVVVERGDDQQHQVGAGGAGLDQLVAVDDEVLAQHGYVDRGPHRAQVVEAAAEPALLGEHADRGGTAGGVLPGQRGRVGDLGEVALARAAPLDLGDHARARRPQVRHRVARRVDVGERGPQVGHGIAASRREVLAHAGDDVVEHGHAEAPRDAERPQCSPDASG